MKVTLFINQTICQKQHNIKLSVIKAKSRKRTKSGYFSFSRIDKLNNLRYNKKVFLDAGKQ